MRNFRAEGIIIKRKNYGESDRIITVLTKQYGKMQLKASGVRKITSRRSAHVELLNHSLLSVHKSNAFPILIEAELVHSFSPIKSDLQKVGLAYHLCELVDGLCPEGQEQPQVFELLYSTLTQLAGEKKYEQEETVNTSLSLGDKGESTYGPSNGFAAVRDFEMASIIHNFEVDLLRYLGFWHGDVALSQSLDTQYFIEQIIERKLKSKRIFSKMG
jgi:hypothetical protein